MHDGRVKYKCLASAQLKILQPEDEEGRRDLVEETARTFISELEQQPVEKDAPGADALEETAEPGSLDCDLAQAMGPGIEPAPSPRRPALDEGMHAPGPKDEPGDKSPDSLDEARRAPGQEDDEDVEETVIEESLESC